MANAYRVRQYFIKNQVGDGSTTIEFADMDAAKTAVGLSSAHLTTGSPTVSYSNNNVNGQNWPFQALIVTFEFGSEADQTSWYDAMQGANWYNSTNALYSKCEWLHEDGTVSFSTDII